MIQSNNNVLAVRFTCANTIAQGDIVEISADNTVAVLSAAGSAKVVGSVDSYAYGATECVVATRFRQRRDDRIAGEDLAVGAFVFGDGSKVYQYTPATAATHTGANAQTFAIVQSTSDVLGVKIGGDEVQSITLTAGGALTAAEIVAEINTSAVGFIASATSANKIKLTATGVNQSLEVTAETHSCNTVLGLTAGVYIGTANSHDPSSVAGLVIKAGDAGDAVETLEF